MIEPNAWTNTVTDAGQVAPTEEALPAWPVETDIYILPTGEVVIADLPAELRALIQSVGMAALPITECEAHAVDESDQSN